MDIKEKMKLCFNDELIENKILTENEKKVLASLMYSYMICKESKDNIIIRSMDALRKDIKINKNDMYDAIRNLESLYHMIERTAGESRGKERSSIASQFKLNFEAILHPPKERLKFDFSKKAKSSETSINTAVIDTITDIDTNIVKDTNIDRDTVINEGTNTIIDKDIKKDAEIDTNRSNDIEIEKVNDVVFENEISNNSIYNILYNLDNYFINSNLQTYDDIQVKSQLNEMISSFKHVKDIKQLIPILYKIFDYIKEHQDKFISWRVEELKDKIELIMNHRFKELN